MQAGGNREHHLDTRGLACPLPVLKVRKALQGMAPGDRLRVEATDPMAAVDIPHFLNESGDRLVDTATADGILTFLIEKA